jgi:hypothetical protein
MSPSPSAEQTFPNPFGPLVGQPLDDRQIDVPEINSQAFEACRRLVEDVAAGGYAAALTVFGDAGTGKTHLIGRVRRWLDQQPRHVFVFVRMETSPAGIWRHLRRCLALSLLQPGALERLLGRRKSELDTLANRDLSIVLEHLLQGRHVRDSAAWLRGEGLPEDVLRLLGLSSPGPDDDQEVTSRHVLIELCELIHPGVVVFCLDQIEAIMSSADDRDGPHAFGKAVACLVDETRNSAVICCEQSAFVMLMEQILDNAAQTRVLGRRAAISPLTWDLAQRLISARLATLPELAAERSKRGGCWPLPEAKLRTIFVGEAAPARKIIARCKDLFDEWQSGRSLPVEPLETALQKMLDERSCRIDSSETEATLRNGMPLLARSAGLSCSVPGNRSPLEFVLNDGKIAIGLCNQPYAPGLVSHLKKISAGWKPAAQPKLLLLRDARLPISSTAKITNQLIAALAKQGARMIPVSQEAVQALAALRRLLADAESGDLAHHGEPVKATDVQQWIAGHLPAALGPLVAEFGASKTDKPDLTLKLATLLAEMKMIKLEDAAIRLEVTAGEVEECARRDPRQFGILGGRLPALFQPITGN